MNTTERKWMSPVEVAEEFNISTKTVYRRMDDGRLPQPVRLSKRCLRFNRAEVMARADDLKEKEAGRAPERRVS